MAEFLICFSLKNSDKKIGNSRKRIISTLLILERYLHIRTYMTNDIRKVFLHFENILNIYICVIYEV